MATPFFTEAELHPYFTKHPNARKRFIGLVGCGKAKQSKPAAARDLYTGSLTRLAIRWMDRNCELFFILSAKHGLLHPDTVIDPYNVKLSDYSDEERESWGNWVADELEKLFNYQPIPFMVLAGSDYSNAFMPKITSLGLHEYVYEACRGLKMGSRMRWIRNHPVLTQKVLKEIDS